MGTIKAILKVLLGSAFVLGGINHFADAPFYLRMMPDFLPATGLLVQLSGVTEVIAGVMVLVPRVSHHGARFVVVHLVVFFIVHIWMALNPGRFPDIPPAALQARLVLQFVFIGWASLFVRAPRSTRTS